MDKDASRMDAMTWVGVQRVRATAWLLIGGGAALLLGAVFDARDGIWIADQLALLMSGGPGALAAAGFGAALLLSADLHAEWRALDDVEVALRARSGAGGERVEPAPARVSAWEWLGAERDRVCGVMLAAIGAVVLIAGYFLLADSLYFPDQVSYLVSAGLSGLLLVIVGACVLLLADLRDEEHKLDRIEQLHRGVPLLDARLVLSLAAAGLIRSAATANRAGGSRPKRWTVMPVAGLTVGAVLIVVGWVIAARALDLDHAMDGLVIATAGVGVGVVGMAGPALLLRHNLNQRIHQVLGSIRNGIPASAAGAAAPQRNGQEFWTATGLHRYHRESCPALTGFERDRLSVARTATELQACELCDAGR